MISCKTNPKLSFTLICALIGFPQLSETIYTPSLPSIVEGLTTNAHLVEWTLSIYFIGFALGVGFWGALADKIGRRKVMLFGLVVYCIATLLCWQASSIYHLLGFRLIQAAGASVGSVITQTMLRDVLSGKERNAWFALIGVPLSLAPALGPVLGSLVDAYFDWRANFILLFMIGLTLTLICSKKLPETKPAILAPAPLVKRVSYFYLARQIVLDRKVMGCAFLVAAINGLLFSFYAEAPFILMNEMQLTATQYGLVGLIVALAGLIGSLTTHRLLKYLTPLFLIMFGCCMIMGGSIGLFTVAYFGLLSSNTLFLGMSLFLSMIFIIMLGGMGFAIPNLLSLALTEYQAHSGKAGSIFGLFYYLLIALFTAGMGLLHDGTVLMMPRYFCVISLIMIIVAYYSLLRPMFFSSQFNFN